MKTRPTLRTLQRGSMLLEAVFGIVIFSLGILALVGLNAASAKQAAASKYRTDAALLANDYIGQMWASQRGQDYMSSNFSGGLPLRENEPPVITNPFYSSWYARVVANLPGASAKPPVVTIANSFSGVSVATLTIYWKHPGEASSAPYHQYTVSAQVSDL
ncbi:hypothetical protein V8J88_04605 [Massilia sp. W12]|uniref:type IV pilus modification PilV family protein n=1 Tax=Massilia sp. W12 TaxID=3126507 RepID=UPI0030CBEB12